jgi:glycogen operon protein
VDNTGIGANVNVANPMTQALILGSLRWFHETLGVDGFRYDLAPVLGNTCSEGCFTFDKNGLPARIARELPNAAHLAEPWAFGTGTYQLGNFPAGWADWNGEFRDGVRRVQNKLGVEAVTPATVRELLSGSPAKLSGPGRASINYVVSHDGFTLRDLYACNVKDNAQAWPYGPSNGGDDANLSWDQGGDAVRQRAAARTGLTVLLTAAGVPMITGGDEVLRTQRCNNNPFNVDSVGTWIDWATLGAAHADVQTYAQRLLRFRAAHAGLRSGPRTWQRANGAEPDGAYFGDPANTFLGFHAGEVFVAWNWGTAPVMAVMPGGAGWALAFESGTGASYEPGGEVAVSGGSYALGARSAAVFVAR